MNANFIEEVKKLRVVDTDSLQRVVCVVQYKITCQYLGEEFVNMFDVSIPSPNPENFTDFNSLTKDQVLDWVRSVIGQQALDERKQAMILMVEQITQSKMQEPKEVLEPWSN